MIPKPSIHQLALFKVPATSTILCPRIQYYFPLKFKYHKNMISTQKFIENKSLDSAILGLSNKTQTNVPIIAKPFSDKPKILHSFSNKEYQTFLTENTTINDITDEQLIIELKAREMVKIDTGNTAVNIKLKDDSVYLLGNTKHGIKLSSLGQAYVETFFSNTQNNNHDLPKFSNPISEQNLKIIIPPKSENDCFIETGKQKHLLVVVDENNRIFPLCYLTSKSTAQFLSHQQFKNFQNQKEDLDINITNKKQSYVKFNQLMEIDQKDVIYVKWDKEYLQNLTKTAFAELRAIFEILSTQQTCEFYNNKGLTKEDCLKMCIEHDKIAEKKGAKHPLSADQIKQNEINKEKMKLKSQQD